MTPSILITGISGLLGSNLALLLRGDFAVTGTYNAHPVRIPGVRCLPCDLRDYAATRELLTREAPDIVLHCASRTDLDAMEADSEGAWRANVLTTRNVVDALRDLQTKLVYISTDAVYPGLKGHYAETAATGPRNVYGATKLEGEALALARPGALVLRTNLFGWNIREKMSLGEWFTDNLRAKRSCPGFSDAVFSGIYTFLLGSIIRKCLERGLSGTYNCASSDSMTKLAFGQALARVLGADPALVSPMLLSQAPLTAVRGRNLSLDVSRLEHALGEPLPRMTESIAAFAADLGAGLQQRLREGMAGLPDRVFYPVREELGYGGQCIDEADIEAVVRVLKSPLLTQGTQVPGFEQAVAEYCGAQHGVAVNSGTAALHLACLALGLGPGDELVTSPITFVASANCARYCGATPVFCDIDTDTGNMDPEALEKAITPRTRAVIPVHFAGQSCDMAALRKVVDRAMRAHGTRIHVIEDASHALGSRYQGQRVGGCQHSDMAVFSFHPVKHITTGEGGLVTTNDPALAEELALLRSHGVTRDPARLSQNPGPWYYEQIKLGYNYRITDLQCALGLSQLGKLDWFISQRRRFVDRYNGLFSTLPHVRTPHEHPDCASNFHLYVARIDFPALGASRADLFQRLGDRGIHAQVHYIPVHQQPDFVRLLGRVSLPNAEAFYAQCISLPLMPTMTDADVDHVVECLAR